MLLLLLALGCEPSDLKPAETGASALFEDYDGDGHGSVPLISDEDEPWSSPLDDDCDDADPDVYPGADEVCNLRDDDCDGDVDEADALGAPIWYTDEDGDTWGDADRPVVACRQPRWTVARSEDCDDSDPDVHPLAPEACDGKDNDCDGLIDDSPFDETVFFEDADGDGYGSPLTGVRACDPTGLVDNDDDCDDSDPDEHPGALWYVDADGDGYGAGSPTTTCLRPEGSSPVGGDCDDDHFAVHPGATETCNGYDDDCDGLIDAADPDGTGDGTWYADADGDGHGDSLSPLVICTPPPGYVLDGDDCDDTDPGVWPGAPEVCGDGVPNGCRTVESAFETCLPTVELSMATAVIVGSDYEGLAGFVSAAGDVDGDGMEDVLIGAPGDDTNAEDAGAVALFFSPIEGEVSFDSADALVLGTTENASLGRVCRVGDVDGDGLDDLFVGATYNEESGTLFTAYLFYSPLSGAHDTSEAHLILEAMGASGPGVLSMTGVGDTNGDGLEDMLVGVTNLSDGGADSGAGFLVLAGAEGTMELSDADAILVGDLCSGLGYVADVGDVDGDGLSDLLFGMGHDEVAARLFLSPQTGFISEEDADLELLKEKGDIRLGNVAGAGDADGDGLPDLAVGVESNVLADYGGAAYVLGGSSRGSMSLADADLRVYGEQPYGEASFVADAGDVDGDGLSDLLVGAWREHVSGAVHLVLGGRTGTLVLAEADLELLGEGESDVFYLAAGLGDLDGDGRSDLLVGALLSDRGGYHSGTAWILETSGWY